MEKGFFISSLQDTSSDSEWTDCTTSSSNDSDSFSYDSDNTDYSTTAITSTSNNLHKYTPDEIRCNRTIEKFEKLNEYIQEMAAECEKAQLLEEREKLITKLKTEMTAVSPWLSMVFNIHGD